VNILTLSTVFPNPTEVNFGLFVRARLWHMAESASIRVMAPVPLMNYRMRKAQFRPQIPLQREDGKLTVYHRRWVYPPMGGVFNAFFLFLQTLGIALRLNREAPVDIIDSHFAHPDGIAAALLALVLHLPFTVTLRGNETLHGSFRLRRAAMAWALRRAARVITVSEALRQYAISLGCAPDRVKTIPNGVDVSIFHTRPEGAIALPRVIFSAGYLIQRKGYDRLIRAVAALRDHGIECELRIAGGTGGETAYEAELHRLVTEFGLEESVHFLGAVPPARLAKLMSEAGVFCLASSREGWPNVVHEAQACGAPVVATDIGGVPEMIPSREYGFVIPAGDQKALEEALAEALTTQWDRRRIAQWGQSRSWHKVAQEVLELFAEVVDKRTAMLTTVNSGSLEK
jgi:glycosyltransferase involved in cell wall biosynthesis